MAVDDPTAPRISGLKTVLDTIVSPKEAFEAIRIVPTWGWALAIAVLLSALASFLMTPAFQHAFSAGWPDMVAKNPNIAQAPADQQSKQLAFSLKIFEFSWIFSIIVVPIICLVEAVVMLIFNAVGRGDGNFARYFAASCNIAVPSAGLATMIGALIVLMRGADSFSSMQAVQGAVPSLGMLAPVENVKLHALLSTVNPFTLWGLGLSVLAMLVVGRVPKLQAWLAGIVLFVVPALIATAFAK